MVIGSARRAIVESVAKVNSIKTKTSLQMIAISAVINVDINIILDVSKTEIRIYCRIVTILEIGFALKDVNRFFRDFISFWENQSQWTIC